MGGHLRLIVATMCLLLCEQKMQAVSALTGDTAHPAPVTGESWLNHLHRSFGDTSMGKTGRLGPPPAGSDVSPSQPAEVIETWPTTTTLRGADLYRLNCRACHGEAGLGAPPEINSVVNPVRATSVLLVIKRMKSTGMDITPAAAAELAEQSKSALLLRLHNGGESMPPFPHLSEAEIRVLLAYLNQLAGVTPAGSRQNTVKESSLRVGEHIVKSTCHICHDATGANPSYQELEDGAIPPLETLPARVNEAAFIRKVTTGAPIVMGTPPTPHRGRMPVFAYLTREEAADVYLYLTQYPPAQDASDGAIALLQQRPQSPGGSPRSGIGPGSTPASGMRGDIRGQSEGVGLRTLVLLSAMGAFVIALLAAGLGFTVHEFRRLSRNANATRMASSVSHPSRREVADLVAR